MDENLAKSNNKTSNYELLLKSLKYYLIKEDNLISKLANLSAYLNYFLKDINWVGFYLYDGEILYLGPFQGNTACTKIKMGSGVCGKAAKEQKTIIVDDVAMFDGHITCDVASQSEIVVPIIKNKQLIGVLDIDSPLLSNFDEVDQVALEKVIQQLVSVI